MQCKARELFSFFTICSIWLIFIKQIAFIPSQWTGGESTFSCCMFWRQLSGGAFQGTDCRELPAITRPARATQTSYSFPGSFQAAILHITFHLRNFEPDMSRIEFRTFCTQGRCFTTELLSFPWKATIRIEHNGLDGPTGFVGTRNICMRIQGEGLSSAGGMICILKSPDWMFASSS